MSGFVYLLVFLPPVHSFYNFLQIFFYIKYYAALSSKNIRMSTIEIDLVPNMSHLHMTYLTLRVDVK